ncbi:Laminin subunit alpha-3 [Gossypium arboreum]|uniref:Laminin subunit alpha-3 n=1 Tax=Gossypium arboreum TaxID=29729 RepID=A0A0B0P6G3_GOSAR|nr:Laminin subunit alpha-3 [Gossypium arboreum]
MLTQIGMANRLFKWPIFVHMGRDTGVCLSRVRYTAMWHDRVSPGTRPRPRHMSVSCGRVSKSVCMPHFDTT